ncbi:MAG: hypothetical protein LQ351_006732 [Letrouitia transgressa]|nr:MAG: hypothetical protein LQ351_006732 [Letrouitia transgressa]
MGLTSWLGKKLVADDAALEHYRRTHTIVIHRPKNPGAGGMGPGGIGPGGMGPMATMPMGGQDAPGGPRYADEDAGGGYNPYAGSERGSARSGSRARSENEGAYDVGAMSDPAYTTRGSNRGQRKRNGQRSRRGAGNGHGQQTPRGSQHGDPNGFLEDEYYDPYEASHGYGVFDDYGGYGGQEMPGGYGGYGGYGMPGAPHGYGISAGAVASHMARFARTPYGPNSYGEYERPRARMP